MNLEVIASYNDLVDEGLEKPLTALLGELAEASECHATEAPDGVLVRFLSIMTGRLLTCSGKTLLQARLGSPEVLETLSNASGRHVLLQEQIQKPMLLAL